jgi:hypothetical protein
LDHAQNADGFEAFAIPSTTVSSAPIAVMTDTQDHMNGVTESDVTFQMSKAGSSFVFNKSCGVLASHARAIPMLQVFT